MWLMMSLEQPIVTAAVARLPGARVNLAAFGITFAVALIIESPVIMLLTAGTALARDRQSYRLLLRFTTVLAAWTLAVHLLVALSPAYAWIVGDLIRAPRAVVEPGRLALVLMFAWSPAIAFRRLWQGVMIRHDRARRAGVTTLVRLAALVAVCVAGVAAGNLPGAMLAGAALTVAVTAEAVAAWAMVRPTVRAHLAGGAVPGGAGSPDNGAPFVSNALTAAAEPAAIAPPVAVAAPIDARTPAADGPLTSARLTSFYVPLALTSLIVLGVGPVLTFGMGRTTDALVALAVWPVTMALTFLFRSGAYAHQEVVVALLDRPGGRRALAPFTAVLALVLSGLLAVVAWTPLADLWLGRVTGLDASLVAAAAVPLRLLIPVPALSVFVSWYRGRLVVGDRTPVITQAVVVNLVVLAVALIGGLVYAGDRVPGAVLAAAALVASLVAEVAWLRLTVGRIAAAARAPVTAPIA